VVPTEAGQNRRGVQLLLERGGFLRTREEDRGEKPTFFDAGE